MSNTDTTNAHTDLMESITELFRSFGIMVFSISEADLKQALENVSMVHTLGSMLDPTAYRTALSDNRLDRQERLIKLTLHIQKELAAIYPDDPMIQHLKKT